MLIRLGAAISIMVQNLQLRGERYYFYRRVPQHLIKYYGKPFIRKSLNTSDLKEATRRVEAESRKYEAEFKVLSEGRKLIPSEVSLAARQLADQYDLDKFIDYVIEPARQAFAEAYPDKDFVYDLASPSDYLKPHEFEAWKIVANPESFRLSDTLQLYLKTHQRGTEDGFVKKVTRDWSVLADLIGDIELDSLSRAHARQLVDHLIAKGNKTGTVRRTLNTLGAVAGKALTELESRKPNPFKNITIQSEGKDTKDSNTANAQTLVEIAKECLSDKLSAVALITVLQMELGTRIGEISGLSIDDVFLDNDVPHIHFRPHPWRSLKNAWSNRRIPVVGVALEALTAALELPRTGKGLFEQYAHERGNDAASAAVNKRLKKWGMTSHSFRHTMKDRLREAGCPKDIRDAIQGHAGGDIAETYGQGHTLQTMQKWLQKISLEM